jgi:hypothetical protein
MRLQIAGCRLAIAASLGLLVAVPSFANAQEGRDSLRARVMERFIQNYRQTARLTDEQFPKLQDAVRQSFEERSELQRRERALWMAIEGQLRPGVAANADSLTRLLDALVALPQEHAGLAGREQARFAEFLSPVQRALLTMQFRRLQEQIERIRQERGPPPRRRPSR